MKGLLSTLNRSVLHSVKGFKNVPIRGSSSLKHLFTTPSSSLHVSSSLNLFMMNNNLKPCNYTTSLIVNNNNNNNESSTSKPLNQLEQSMLQGITSIIQANNESFSSGDYITIQKRYEHIEHLKLIEKKEELILPFYKLEWKIACVLQIIGEYEQAVIKITSALNSKEGIEEIPQMKIIKASILNSMGLNDQGFELHNKAIQEIGPKVTWKNGLEASLAFHELGEYYLNRGETGKAVQNFEKSLSISEGFYGWMSPQTTKTALLLSRLYLETNKVDFSVILGEKALIGIELFLDLYEAQLITISGSYLARAYERKGFYPFQQSTISRVYNILRRKKNETDTQTYMECVFKLENMMGSCRFFQGHLKLADQTFTKLDQLAESVMPEWIKKDSEEAQFELAYMKYFKGISKIGLKENSQGISELEQARKIFLNLQRQDWALHCDQYINKN
ncbi:predicted protein [Naegleria gruberi]|uniref:Predicted protein n=1 Tax=Naegleria gruberi TaxID=5762 RepID=D2VQ51_NAEGR|nr:uncharacterized protein NAEGRDRAFT_71024 [Naegleria gruberi]EFC40989.1 predicted protein [Naegleria gruberi]|eukprot:XP_002673733.1 predicted protein [Naegleria gruberi strain NEG-M]